MEREEARAVVSSLYESWYSSLISYVYRQTGNLAQAEDVVQDTFLELYKVLRDGGDIGSVKAWTLTVARRHLMHRIKADRRVVSISDPLARIHEAAADAPDPLAHIELDEITRMFSVLTPREEEVLLLRLQALKYREIARQLGIGPTSVNTLLARALQKLREAVGVRGSSHVEAARNGA